MGSPMPDCLQSAFSWWVNRLVDQGMDPWEHDAVREHIRTLPATSQRGLDNFSCGILAVNGLSHHYVPEVELLDATPTAVAIERIISFNRICTIHRDTVVSSIH